MKYKKILLLFSFTSFIFASIMLISSDPSFVGAVIGTQDNSIKEYSLKINLAIPFMLLSSLTLILAQLMPYAKEKKVIINLDHVLSKEAKKAKKNIEIEFGLEHLTKELRKGNLNAGIGSKHLVGTDINYMRDRSGARLFYVVDNQNRYKVVGMSSKHDEQKVINHLKKGYFN